MMILRVDMIDGEILSLDRMSRKKNCSLNPTSSEQYNIDNHQVAVLTEEPAPVGDVVSGTQVAELRGDGKWYRIYDIRSFTVEEIATRENAWASQMLAESNRPLAAHNDAHGRAVGTKPQWIAYRNKLRDHVIDGVVQDTRAEVEALKPS
jgi:hypothetical protein